MRLAIVISSLGPGGAERVASVLSNQWSRKGVDVTLITHANLADAYQTDFSVRRLRLTLDSRSRSPVQSVWNNANRVFGLHRAISEVRPDIVVSFVDTTNVLTLAAAARLNTPVIAVEQIAPLSHPLGRPWQTLRRLLYPRAAAIVVMSERTLAWGNTIAGRAPVVVIPNPIWIPRFQHPSRELAAVGPRRLVAMGRLDEQKGFDLLVDAFAKCAPAHPDWELTILGEGAQRAAIESQCRKRGLSGRVHLPGRVENPVPVLRSAHLFALSSRYEGMPNALLEAMACGLPAVSFDCPTGPREVISDGVNGLLVPSEDVDAFAGALDNMMSDDRIRELMASRTVEVYERFGIDRVLAMWDDLFESVRGKYGVIESEDTARPVAAF